MNKLVVVAGVVGVSSVAWFLASRKKSSASAPKAGEKMKKIFLIEPNSDMEKVSMRVESVEIPRPRAGQVLVKMAAAPVNPSDYGGWLAKKYGMTYPLAIGNEGAGTVVATGGGLVANSMMGRAVGVIAQNKGSYGEYVCVDAMTQAFPLEKTGADVADAASFFVNPYTVVAILDTVKTVHKSKIFIHTAAASQLGQMMVKVAPSQGIEVVNIVRRVEQAEMLTALGAKYVICQADSDWETKLAALISEHKITVAFDCIAGEMPGKLLSLLPNRSTTYVYGGLSKTPVGGLPVMDLIYRNKVIKGFLLPNWLSAGGPLKTMLRIRKASKLVNPGLKKGGWAESKFFDSTLESMQSDFLKQWNGAGFTNAKLRIMM